MNRIVLRDDQWGKIESLISGGANDCSTGKENRLFLEAVLYKERNLVERLFVVNQQLTVI